MFHLPPSEGHYQFHPNSINEFCKCFIVSLFQKRGSGTSASYILLDVNSRGDRCLSHSSRHTQVPSDYLDYYFN